MLNMFGQMGSALIGGAFQMGSEKQNFEHQKQLAAQQNQYNIDMWKMQNEYNSPQAQMQRLKDAGLNPMLMYGQGTTGNASSAPQQVTPDAPHYGKAAQELAKVFNLEAIKTVIANRMKAEADAKDARINANRNEMNLNGEYMFHNNFRYDISTGRYVFDPVGGAENVSDPMAQRYVLNRIMPSTFLPHYRANLLQSQNSYLAPQIEMANYQSKYYPVSYWIGQGGNVVKSLGEVTSWFNPSRYLMPLKRGGQFLAPNGKVYNY